MRIISGTAKGRILHAPRGQKTRPTADRVKEAVFSTLSSKIPEARVFDVFAGTGALGLEALSRGAKEAVLTESSRTAFLALEKNVQAVALPNAFIYQCDCLKMIPVLKSKKKQFDIIFLDPPYNCSWLDKVVEALLKANLLAEDGLLVVETAFKEQEVFAKDNLELLKRVKYSDTIIEYYRKTNQS